MTTTLDTNDHRFSIFYLFRYTCIFGDVLNLRLNTKMLFLIEYTCTYFYDMYMIYRKTQVEYFPCIGLLKIIKFFERSF